MILRRRNYIFILVLAALIVCGVVWRPQLLALWQPEQDSNILLLSGNIEAHESVLSFKSVQSRILELPFHEGQSVRKDTVLAVVDSADYRQQLAIAQGNLDMQRQQVEAARQNLYTAGRTLLVDQAELAQRKLDQQRALDLQQRGFTSMATLDQAATALQQASAVLERDQSVRTAAARSVDVALANMRNADATVALARIVLGYTSLVAPFDGVVSVQQAEIGEVVVPGTPVLTLTDLDHVWLRAYVNERDLGRVQMGQEVIVVNDSRPDKRYQGRISFIADKAEFTPKSVETHVERVNLVYRIKIDISNPDHQLVPGMPADARITLQPARS